MKVCNYCKCNKALNRKKEHWPFNVPTENATKGPQLLPVFLTEQSAKLGKKERVENSHPILSAPGK
jgi:hypothetical protein